MCSTCMQTAKQGSLVYAVLNIKKGFKKILLVKYFENEVFPNG